MWDASLDIYAPYLERLSDFFLRVRVLHFPCHHGQELCHIFSTPFRTFQYGSVPGKSIVPLLSASTSFIMSCSSDSEGFWPSDRITVPSSFVVICPNSESQRHD